MRAIAIPAVYYRTGASISSHRLLSAYYVVGFNPTAVAARVSQTTISNDGHSLATVSSRPASALTDAKCSLLGASHII